MTSTARSSIATLIVLAVGAVKFWVRGSDIEPEGTIENPVVDSAMTDEQAFEGHDPKCPIEIINRQKMVTVWYYSFDKKIHRGQLVVDEDLEEDIKEVFRIALNEAFPIQSVIPISEKRFRKDGRWDDDLSMAANNTSAFNYRPVTGGNSLSTHSYGRAIDINPIQNPYLKGATVLPTGAKYDPKAEGTLTADHAITRAFLQLGWEWGGNWEDRKDYQHFQKAQMR